jgi:hypothetical protein
MVYQRTLSSSLEKLDSLKSGRKPGAEPCPESAKPVIFITGLRLIKIRKLHWKGNRILASPTRAMSKCIPTVATLLAFLGKTYFLVGTLANFRQLSVVKLSRTFRRSRCPELYYLAQNLSPTPGLSFRSKKIPLMPKRSVDGFLTIVFGVFR